MKKLKKNLANTTIYCYVKKWFDGIGVTRAREIISRLGLRSCYVDMSRFSENGKQLLDEILTEYCSKKTKAEVIRRQAIFNLQKNRSRRGKRHRLGLPVRGQRTHTNA